MQSIKSTHDDLQLRTEKEILIYSTQGKVHSVRSFASRYLDRLSRGERAIINEYEGHLSDEYLEEVPFPWARTPELHDGRRVTNALRVGARSALLPSSRLKLKACRPLKATFPSWRVDEHYRLKTATIPFGVLGPEGVMRELLGHCFLRRLKLPVVSTPIAVMEYQQPGFSEVFSLVSMVEHDERLETRLDCGNLTLRRLLCLHASPDWRRGLGGEVGLKGVDVSAYVERKTSILIRMNFNGGLRGILNSNIGNDVVSGSELVGICDFDTFSVRGVPGADERDGIRTFVFDTWLELIKTSLPMLDYLDVSSLDDDARSRVLAGYYTANSTICASYRARFLAHARELKWDMRAVATHIDDVLRCDLARHLLEELIPNAYSVDHFCCDSWYVPHD